jgi:TonB family protein
MALSLDESTGSMALAGAAYFDWDPAGSPVSIHMHMEALAGLVRDVAEGFKSLPRRGLEVGGLLLGRVEAGERPTVWIERYQRISCEHKFGPQFVLDESDKAELEKAAAGILEGGELAVVGLYRSHTREGFQLEEPDFDLVRRYFSDASDLILLIKPESATDISARFYVHDKDGGAQTAGDPFPFRGRIIESTGGVEAKADEKPEEVQAESVSHERPRRLVPDFVPSPVVPSVNAPSVGTPSVGTPSVGTPLHAEGNPVETGPPQFLFPPRDRVLYEEEEPPSVGDRLKKWLPLVALMLLAGGALWWFSQPGSHQSPSAAAVTSAEPARPLGLSVEPMGQEWRVSWNPSATALHDARSVQLFVREGDDQNRIDLAPRDLAAGIYKYRPTGNDVTFRLEVVENGGRVSAESFRFVRNGATPAIATPAVVTPPAAPPPTTKVVRRTEPRAIHRAPPVVAAGIRPRITGTIAIDVRVHIDEQGRVTSAVPVVKPHQGLDSYLSASAVQAARLWRFEPARENGKAVPGTQTIHFVFQK